MLCTRLCDGVGICGLGLGDYWAGTGRILLQNAAFIRAELLNSLCHVFEWGGTVQV